ncbi:hypothetical protein M2138_001803, partial [Dysgonomonadaceae bacterium PH5-43]|nr:hypothetical protein [Dysgonomonadaceae bacterium PH5-43]
LLMPLLISDDTIYIGNPADEGDTFYSVPKSLDSGLKMINVDAAVGIMTMQNKVYVGFTHLMLYYDVTTEASRSENGIKLASISIEEE